MSTSYTYLQQNPFKTTFDIKNIAHMWLYYVLICYFKALVFEKCLVHFPIVRHITTPNYAEIANYVWSYTHPTTVPMEKLNAYHQMGLYNVCFLQI